MNNLTRKELQKWLDNFPEDTEIKFLMGEECFGGQGGYCVVHRNVALEELEMNSFSDFWDYDGTTLELGS